MAQKHTWKNSLGREFTLNVIPPFFEETVIKNAGQTLTEPPVPHYAAETFSPDGKPVMQYYPYSEEALTEEVFTDTATGIIDGLLSPNGNKVRWQDWVTPNDKRAWLGYKSKLAQYNQLKNKEAGEETFKRLLCSGINVEITDEWRADFTQRYGYAPDEEKYQYLLDQVCVSNDDYWDLATAITEIRQISKERVDALTGGFRKAKERNTPSETA